MKSQVTPEPIRNRATAYAGCDGTLWKDIKPGSACHRRRGPRANLEPRACVNTPVGMNFIIASYAYSERGVAIDASLPIQGAELKQNSFVLG